MPLPIERFVLDTRYGDLPKEVRAVMRRSLLDNLGVAAIGRQSRISQIVRGFAAEHQPAAPGGRGARLMFDGRRVATAAAAMAGAFSLDSIDAHDGHSGVKGHAGSAVLPAVLAMIDDLRGQGRAFTGPDMLAAIAVAYEVGYRSGLCLHGTVDDYHTSGAWTAVGVAAAGARLLGLDGEGVRQAVGIAEYHGPRSQMMRCIDHPSMVRDGVGWGAPAGVDAAHLAERGFTGAPAITTEGAAAEPWWHDLGERWEILATHYKPYPVCRWAHPAIDAAGELMRDHGLASADVAGIRIQTFHNATRLAGQEPRNIDELSYSIAFPVATMVARGRIGPDELDEAVLDDAEILRLSRATELVETEHYTRISVGKRWADVTLVLADGRQLQSEPRTPRGDPEDPLSDDELSAKFHLLADPVLGSVRTREIEARIPGLEEAKSNLAEFLDLVLEPV